MSLKTHEHWAISAQLFVQQWLQGQEKFTITTSGSTGMPKLISLKREAMIASALATIETLKLDHGISALIGINTAFIGGQMMLVRAIVGDWQIELIKPSLDFYTSCRRKEYNFTALVPLQVSTAIKSVVGRALLNDIDQIIIGGASVSKSLLTDLQNLRCQCHHTYGMTETVSHIGLKPLNGPHRSDWFTVTGDNQVQLNGNGCLKIKGTVTDHKWITTNDLAEIHGQKFKWLGRADLVVNTGGIKILIEQTENEINRLLPTELRGTLMLWKKEHKELGEELIGISNDELTAQFIHENWSELVSQMAKYSLPKTWFTCSVFEYTNSGKLDRKRTFEALMG